MSRQEWTPERIEELKRRFHAGETISVIASEMTVTRSTIGGKLFRLGLHRKPVVNNSPEVKKNIATKRSLKLHPARAQPLPPPKPQMSGNTQMSGNARMSGNAQLSGDARMFDNAWMSGNTQMSGNARMSGNAQLSGDARVYGIMRSDGYCFVYVPCADGEWRIIAGCRYFTMPAARAHWSNPYYRDAKLAAETRVILDCLEKLRTVKPDGV